MKKGDAIAAIAQPIARTIDALAGTNVSGCSGCKQMQTNLNSGMSLADAVIARWFTKQGEKMGQPYVITEQTVIEDAESPSDAISKKIAGEGQAISINAQVRVQPQKPPTPK